ncbi:hypothetical protein D3C71_1241380 [compost metagenome]
MVEQAGVGGQVGARRPPDRLLIDVDQTLDRLGPVQPATGAFDAAGLRQVAVGLFDHRLLPQVLADQFDQRLADQTRLARTGDTGHRRERTERKARVHAIQVVAMDTLQRQPAGRRARRAARACGVLEKIGRGKRGVDRAQAVGRTAVEHLAAVLTRTRADIHQPVRAAQHLQIMLHHEQRVAAGLELGQCVVQGLPIGRMQAGGGLIKHVHHAEQAGADLCRQAQALQFARRQRRGRAVHRQIAQAQRLQRADPFDQIVRDALGRDAFLFGQIRRAAHIAAARMRVATGGHALGRGLAAGAAAACGGGGRYLEMPLRRRTQRLRHGTERQPRQRSDIHAGKRHRQRFALQPAAIADRTFGADHVARHPLLHHRALRGRKGVQHIAARTAEGPHVTGLFLAPERGAGFGRGKAGVDRHHRLFLGEQDPVALLLGQIAPGNVHVVAERDQDVALVLPVPCRRPRGDGALADAQRGIRHHRLFRHFIYVAQPMTVRASALRCIG